MAGRRIKYYTKESALAAKRESNRQSKLRALKNQDFLTKKQQLFAKFLPISKSQNEAAIKAGYSPACASQSASENMRKPAVAAQIQKEELNLRQHLNAAGLDDGNIAKRIKDYLDFNSEVVERGGDAGGRVVSEMRDSRGVAAMIANVVKFKGSSLENTQAAVISEVNADVAWLAIKSLIKKLDAGQLRQVVESCEALLARDCVVVG